jgi:hypothetical protein
MELLTTISDTCSDAALARGITIFHTGMTWVCVIVPILLILSLAISLLSMTINPNQKDGMKKICKKVGAAVIIFLIPAFLNVVMNLLSYASFNQSEIFNFSTCYKVAVAANKKIGTGNYESGLGTAPGKGLSGMFGDLSGLKNYTSGADSADSSTSTSKGDGGILIVAGHSYAPYCHKVEECREENGTYVEPTETRKLAKLLKSELDEMNLKASIANEMLGGTDAKMNRSLHVEMRLNSQEFKDNEAKFKKFTHVIEIHFNAVDGPVKANGTLLMQGAAGISKVDQQLKDAVVKYTGKANGNIARGLQNQRYFQNLGIPMTYIEVEFYDNHSAMAKYEKNKEKIAHELALVFKNNYGSKISR